MNKLEKIILSQSEQIHDLINESKIHYQNFLNQNTETSNKVLEIASQNGKISVLEEKIINAKDTYSRLSLTLNDLEEELENAYSCLMLGGFSKSQINKVQKNNADDKNILMKEYVNYLLEGA